MGASDVERLRADLAVLDRRIDRIEKSAAIATAGLTTVRQKLDGLAASPRGGASVGPERKARSGPNRGLG